MQDEEKYKSIIKKVKKICDLRKKQDEKIKELMNSIIIKKLWGNVLDQRPLRIRIDGHFNEPKKLKYVIQGRDETRSFCLSEVPKPLIKDIIIQYRLHKDLAYGILKECAPDPFKEV